MSVSAILLALATEETITVPSGGYIANQLVQAPSGRAGFIDRPSAALEGEQVVINTDGVVQLPCDTAVLADEGEEAWWDSANDTVLPYVPAVGYRAGTFHVEKVNGVTTCMVALNRAQRDPGVITKVADYTLTAGHAGAVLSNAGAAGTITFALPAAKPGMRFTARVGVAQALRLDPNLTETISLPSTGAPGAAGKYLVADAIGETVMLACVVAGTWSVLGFTGTWTAEP